MIYRNKEYIKYIYSAHLNSLWYTSLNIRHIFVCLFGYWICFWERRVWEKIKNSQKDENNIHQPHKPKTISFECFYLLIISYSKSGKCISMFSSLIAYKLRNFLCILMRVLWLCFLSHEQKILKRYHNIWKTSHILL